MSLIINGQGETAIGLDEFLVYCPSCEANSWADVMVMSRYYHIYWIPLFPFEKDANIICKKCGLKRYGRSFDSSVISNFSEVKNKFRHPWFTYLGIGTLIIITLSIIIAANI